MGEALILCAVMRGRQPHGKLNVHQLIRRIPACGIDLIGDGEQRQDEKPVVLRLITDIGNTLVREGVILPVVKHDVIAKWRPGIAFHQARSKCPAGGLDLFISVVDTD